MLDNAQMEEAALLTTEQVMDILIADARLRRHAATCVLTGVNVSGEMRFRRRDLDAWINLQTSCRTGGTK